MTDNLSTTGIREWHIAKWSALAWLETVIKSIAIAIGIYVFIQALSNGSFAWPVGFELVQFLILVLLSIGLVAAIFDRIHRREIISMIFMIFNNIGHWGITATMLFVPGPGISYIYFIILMLVGDFVKMASFKIDQFSLPGVSRATLYSLTGVYLFGYFLILLFEILA